MILWNNQDNSYLSNRVDGLKKTNLKNRNLILKLILLVFKLNNILFS